MQDFESIVLNEYSLVPIHAFERLLCETPEIADYIRKLDHCFASYMFLPLVLTSA